MLRPGKQSHCRSLLLPHRHLDMVCSHQANVSSSTPPLSHSILLSSIDTRPQLLLLPSANCCLTINTLIIRTLRSQMSCLHPSTLPNSILTFAPFLRFHAHSLLNTNVDGKIKVQYAFTQIKGVGRRYANIVCKKADIDLGKRAGELNSDELERIVTILQNPAEFKIPAWFLNRQRDIVDGKSSQLLSNNIDSSCVMTSSV